MVSKRWLAVGIALFLALLLAVPVLAGGWAVITLDKLPGELVAGEPLSIGFMVRQHGRTPMAGLTPTITARLSGSGKAVVANASPAGQVGHYTAQLTIPEPGIWDWSIQAFTMDQAMPPLKVIAGAGRGTAQISASLPAASWLLVGALGLAGCLVGLNLAFRRRLRLAVPLLIFGLALGIFGFISAAEPAPRAQALSASNLSQVELGRQLFVAKGCITCHDHKSVSRSKDGFYVDAGPNLTTFASASPEFLRAWLKNPISLKPATQMPNLELGETEIEALVAFLTSK